MNNNSIEKLALEYLNSDLVKDARRSWNDEQQEDDYKKPRRRSRMALQKAYDRIRERYLQEKSSVNILEEQLTKLQNELERHSKRMKDYHSDMIKVRENLSKMDDDGTDYMELVEEETRNDLEEENKENEERKIDEEDSDEDRYFDRILGI